MKVQQALCGYESCHGGSELIVGVTTIDCDGTSIQLEKRQVCKCTRMNSSVVAGYLLVVSSRSRLKMILAHSE